jgi:acyl-CoA dehydrogenase
MDFEFTADQEMLRDSVRRFLAARAPIASVRAAYDDATYDPDVWRALVDLGVVGLGMVDSAVVLEELGRALCPVPYASSIAAGALGVEPDGATLAIYEETARYDWSEPLVRATRDGDAWTLDGTKVHVMDACSATTFVVSATDDNGAFGVFVTTSGTASPSASVDGTRKVGSVTFDASPARRLDVSAADVSSALDRLAVAYAVDAVGAASRALELAVEYAQERVQFDKPIGSFQAVQHLCADMLKVVELGRAAAYYACWAADDADPREAHRAATLAAAYVTSAFPQLGGTAIQVFGGIGFTWEHDIHMYYKRLLSTSVVAGNADHHRAELANLAIG